MKYKQVIPLGVFCGVVKEMEKPQCLQKREMVICFSKTETEN